VAEEETEQQGEEGEGVEKAGASPKKKIIIMAAIGLIVLIVAGAVTFMLLGGDDAAEDGSEEQAQEEVVLPAIYLELSPALLTTFNIDGRQRYLQVSLSLMSRDQSALDAVEHHMPLIRSKLNAVYGSSDFELIQTEAGKTALIEGSIKAINGILEKEGESLIEAVYFTNFVMQ
jgi:flagellar protein FliL